jgi:hypothetical protein
MAKFFDFAGRLINIPGTYTKRLFPKEQGSGATIGRVVIMGEATKGGIPYDAFDDIEDVINVVSGQAEALNLFGGGTVYYGSEFYLTPSNDERFNTPGEALCVIVNSMEQAKTTLKDVGTNDIIEIAFNVWGTDGNLAALKLSSGTNTGKLVEVIHKGEPILTEDDVTLNLFDIQYVGAGSAATMTIDATTLSTTVTGAPDDNLSITLAEYPDLGSLINFINDNPAYTCTLTGSSDEKATVFDAISGQDIRTSAYSAVGIVEAIIRQLNSLDTLTANLKTGAARTVPENITDFQYFTGGSVASATTQDWTDALEKLERYNLNNIVVMSGSNTIQQLVKSHVTAMNDVEERKYRQAGLGAGASTVTKSARIAEMKALDSAYMEYCVSSFERYDFVNQEVATFEPFYLYSMIAGLRYANNVGMDVVFKYLNVLSTPDISRQDQKDYAAAGATVIQKSDDANSSNIFEIKINNTTSQSTQPTRTNPAVVYLSNAFSKDQELQVTEQIRSLGEVVNSIIISKIQNWLITELLPGYRDSKGWITDGPDGQKAFDDVKFAIEGEKFEVSETVTLSITPRFMFITTTFITPGQRI